MENINMTNLSTSTKKTSNNQSAVKTMKILEVLADYSQPMRLYDLAKTAKMNASTALRFLNSLIECGYVYQIKDTQKYMLTLKIVSLADGTNVYNRMTSILKDILIDLANKCNESVCLAINQNDQVVYLDAVDGPSRILRATQRIGHRAPLYCTGVGKLMLLDYSEEALDSLADKGMEKLTENTITTLPDLKLELDKIEKNKYAIDDEECEHGLRCIAAPIMSKKNKVVAAISVTGPSGRITDERIAEIKGTVMQAAKRAASLLGY
jgi:DNA-binding IclR family transcriptional regulator